MEQEELYQCSDCGKMFTEQQGSWPKVTHQGTLRIVFYAFDRDEHLYPMNFMCYDCIGESYGHMPFHDEWEEEQDSAAD